MSKPWDVLREEVSPPPFVADSEWNLLSEGPTIHIERLAKRTVDIRFGCASQMSSRFTAKGLRDLAGCLTELAEQLESDQ